MKNKVNIIISIICFVLVIGICIFVTINSSKNKLTDAQKFKKQYEAVSKSVSPYTNESYIEISIAEDNPMIYKTAKEIVSILKHESAVVFMGYPESDLTRTILPIFLEAAKEENIDKVYYLDLFDIRDEFVFSGSIMPEKTKEGSQAYYELVGFLDDYVEEYYVNDSVGNQYDTLVKRINTPTFITSKDGKVIDFHQGAVIYHNEENFVLNDLEQEKLKEIFVEMLQNYKAASESCSSDGAC